MRSKITLDYEYVRKAWGVSLSRVARSGFESSQSHIPTTDMTDGRLLVLCRSRRCARACSLKKKGNPSPSFPTLPRNTKKATMAQRDPQYLNMENSPALSRYSEMSHSQHSYHVSPEPTIHFPEQEDTSEDEDEERESSHTRQPCYSY
jgi:hypothetical protein